MNRNVIEFPKGPSARKPRGRRATNSRNRVPVARQGGRCARTRQLLYVPHAAIAVGWALAFVVLLVPMDAWLLSVAKVVAAVPFAFAIGWIARGEALEP